MAPADGKTRENQDLVALKIFAGGPQDMEDVNGILQVSRENIDRALLRRIAGHYGADVRKKVDVLLAS